MLLHTIKILLPLVIVCLEFGAFVQGLKPKNAGKCTHGGILSGVFLNAGVRPRNDTIFSNITSMEDCISKCCKINKCDLAMKIGKVCHAVRCQDDDSCQISHRRRGSQVRAEITFVTKGEETKPGSQTRPTKTTNRFSSSTNKHPSAVNKRPTIPLTPDLFSTKQKIVNTSPMLQLFKKENQGLANVADVASKSDIGSGLIDENNKEEDNSGSESTEGEMDDDEDSGSSSVPSGQSSGSITSSILDEPSSRDVNTASMNEDSYVLPNVVKVSRLNMPSASRSAIPLASEQPEVGLGLPLITYSREDSSNDRAENGKDSASYDDDDDDEDLDGKEDDGDGDERSFKGRNQEASNKNELNSPSKRPLATTKKVRLYKTTKGSVNSRLKTKVKSRNFSLHTVSKDRGQEQIVAKGREPRHKTESLFQNKDDERATALRTTSHKGKAEAKRGHLQNTVQYLLKGANADRDKEAARALMIRAGSDVIGRQVARKSKNEKSTMTALEAVSKEKLGKDFNDITRAVITKLTGKSDNAADTGKESEKMKLKKVGVAKASKKTAKASFDETPLQRELSTLFAKDGTKVNKHSLPKPSKKRSFDKLKKLQERRDRKRHQSKDQPSLSFLYTKNYGKTKTKFFIHRFSDWHGWIRDQFLNVPQESAKCKRGVTIRGATLRGGILAGDFKTVGIVDNQHTCVSSCCKNKRCDVALMLGKECFNVKCYSSNLCGLAPAAAIFDEVTPIITYVRGHIQKRSIEDQAGQVDEQIINEQDEGHAQLLKWLRIFI